MDLSAGNGPISRRDQAMSPGAMNRQRLRGFSRRKNSAAFAVSANTASGRSDFMAWREGII
jgi:hypothetical protein